MDYRFFTLKFNDLAVTGLLALYSSFDICHREIEVALWLRSNDVFDFYLLLEWERTEIVNILDALVYVLLRVYHLFLIFLVIGKTTLLLRIRAVSELDDLD